MSVMNDCVAQKIPNVYHFVFGLRPQTQAFHLLHYLCLASCLAVNKPDRVVVHLRNRPWGPLWDLIRPQIETRALTDADLACDLRYHDNFMAQYSYAHISDFVRLRVLLKHGGIYADMDTLFVAPPPATFFAAPCVMGRERLDSAAPNAPDGSLCNAYIMAPPQAPFLRIWLERMPHAFDGSWSNHSTFLPFHLAQEFPELIRVEPESRFFALDWTRDGLAALFEENHDLPSAALSLHLWAHLWWDPARRDTSDFNHARLTPDYVAHAPTTYARLARPFLPPRPAPSIFRYQLGRLRARLDMLLERHGR
jgi:hypothetical protein